MTRRARDDDLRQPILTHLEEIEDRRSAIERLENPADPIPLEDLEREIKGSYRYSA